MGLQAYFYDNYTQDNLYNNAPPIPPDTPMVASVPVATVDWDFDAYPLNSSFYEDFVVKFQGYITATESGTADLQCLADDGCIVIIDGVTVIDEWYDKGMEGNVYLYTLVPNQSLPITVWYYENGGGAAIQFRWKLPSGDWTIVPEAVFSPAPKIITIVDVPTETHTVVSETPTVIDTQTPVLDTQTVETLTPVVPSDTQTSNVEPSETETASSESSTLTTPSETSTVPIETPLPIPPPVVEPQPIVIPQPPVVIEPQPEPQPQPEPVEEPVEEQPVVEEQLPVEEQPEPPLEEDTPSLPVDEESEQTPLEPTEPVLEPLPEPIEEPELTSQPDTAPEPPIVIEPEIVPEAPTEPQMVVMSPSLDLSTLAPETPVELENGVVLTAEVVIALQLFENPAELLGELFTDPGKVLTAMSNIGADMSPEVREQSEKVVVSAIIAGGIATQAAAGAAGAAAYRRNT